MKKIFLILIMLIGFSGLAQKNINTEKLYKSNVKSDCSVRALASALDISYSESFQILNGVFVYDKGVKASDFISTIPQDKIKRVMLINNMLPAEFIKLAPEGTYIAISRTHTFTIKSLNGEWFIYGNPDDKHQKIIKVIIINT